MELCDLSASELSVRLNNGEISSKEIVESVLNRIDQRDGDLNAYITVIREQALRQAEQADERIKNKKPSCIGLF